jgi:predicted GIY-YIG superfamily endonuclease
MRNIEFHRDPDSIMADYTLYEIDGFPFWFSHNLMPNGVHVDSSTANVDNERWRAAFKRALELHRTWLLCVELEDFHSWLEDGELRRLADDNLALRRIQLEEVLEHDRTGHIGLDPMMSAKFLFLHKDIVIEIERRAQPLESFERPKVTASERPAVTGYVYLIQSPTGAYKIGRTKNPANRLQTFHVKLPFEVEYVAVISTPDMYRLESNLHRQYASKRVNGEWFMLDAADVEAIKTLAVQS